MSKTRFALLAALGLSSTLFAGCLDAGDEPATDDTNASVERPTTDPATNIAGKPEQADPIDFMHSADADRAKAAAASIDPQTQPDHEGPLTPSAWAVNIAPSASFVWPTQSVTFTANVTAHSGAYKVQIVQDGFTILKTCTSTPCVVSHTESTVTGHGYTAVLYTSGGTYETQSNTDEVYWEGVDPVLSASSHTVKTTGASTVTVTSINDVGSSPFYLQVCDATTNTLLVQCGAGTTCSASVTQSAATTHVYRGYFGAYDSAGTCPSAPLETTEQNYVTWFPQLCIPFNGGQLCTIMETASLSAASYVDGTSTTYTATAPGGIATGDELQIYNQDTGALVGACTSSPCTGTFGGYNGSYVSLAAFIAPPSATLSIANVRASSNTTTTNFEIIH